MSNKGLAEINPVTNKPDMIRHSWFQSVSGITANAAGNVIDMTITPMSKFAIDVIRTDGATNVVNVVLEGSLDGIDWFTLASITDITGGDAVAHVIDKPVRFLRYNIVDIGAGNTVMVNVLASAR